MKIILIFLLMAFTALPALAAEKETAYERVMRTGTLKVGYFVWPPYMMKDPNTGALSGSSADVVKSLSGLLDLKVEWVQMAGLGTQIEDFKRGTYDVVVSDGPYVFSMIKFVDFSNPLFYAPVYAYGRADDERYNSLEQLNAPDITFVGIDGDLSVDLVMRLFEKAKLDTLPVSTDPGMMMQNVSTKKADITILDPPSISTFNKSNKPGLDMVSSEPVAVYPIGFSMMKDDGKLLTLINSGIAAMHNTGSTEPILEKWFPEKNSYYPVLKPYEVKK